MVFQVFIVLSVPLVVLFFLKLSSVKGWNKFFKFDVPFPGKPSRMHIVSFEINAVRYGNAVQVFLIDGNVWAVPRFFFRPFHKPGYFCLDCVRKIRLFPHLFGADCFAVTIEQNGQTVEMFCSPALKDLIFTGINNGGILELFPDKS